MKSEFLDKISQEIEESERMSDSEKECLDALKKASSRAFGQFIYRKLSDRATREDALPKEERDRRLKFFEGLRGGN